MILKGLHLRFFRNYDEQTIYFQPGINLLIGENGQGKTNIIEAVYFLSTARSHRNVEDVEMIETDQPFASIDGVVQYENEKKRVSGLIHRKGKALCIQNEAIKKVSDFIGVMNAVLFSPTDMGMFEAAPRTRRRILDMELGKMSSLYINELSTYNKLLKERNALLKVDQPDALLLESLTERMIMPQVHILKKRHFFVERLNEMITTCYQKMTVSQDRIRIAYESMIPYDADDDVMKKNMQEKYQALMQRDMLLHQTSIGIQREDLLFFINEHPVTSYASQGQKRMMIISLKLALLKLIKEYTGEYPILLLDDVFSELDMNKKNNLLQMIPKQVQTIITATEKDDLFDFVVEQINGFEIKKGVCKPWMK